MPPPCATPSSGRRGSASRSARTRPSPTRRTSGACTCRCRRTSSRRRSPRSSSALVDAGADVRYVKPHGALYHAVTRRRGARPRRSSPRSRQLADRLGRALPVLGLRRRDRARRARGRALVFVREAFLDRGYRPDGSLVARGEPGALLHEPAVGRRARAAARARRRGRGGRRLARARGRRHRSACTATRPTPSRWPARCAPRSTPRASRCVRRGERGAPPRHPADGRSRGARRGRLARGGRGAARPARGIPARRRRRPRARRPHRARARRPGAARARGGEGVDHGRDDDVAAGCRIRPFVRARGRRARGGLRRRRPRRDRRAAGRERRRARAPARRVRSGRSRSPASRRASATS